MEAFTRVFAFELNASSLVLERGEPDPYMVVTPGGARCSNVFICGVLTEVNERSDLLHARVVDPTGGFDVITGRDAGSPGEILRHLESPCFVTVIGKPRLSRNGGRLSVTVRPTAVREVDRMVRDTWVITTAKLTFERLRALDEAMDKGCISPGFSDVYGHYQSSKETLVQMARTVGEALTGVQAVQVVGEEIPDNTSVLLELIRVNSGPKGIPIGDLAPLANAKGISDAEVTRLVRRLLEEDECYQPSAGVIRLL
jgi:RPA family protein